MNSHSSTPLHQVYVGNELLFARSGFTEAHLVGVRTELNRAPVFSVMLDSGSLYGNIPPWMIYNSNASHQVPWNLADFKSCEWDCISDFHEVVIYNYLLEMDATVFVRDTEMVGCRYAFTIEFCRAPGSWVNIPSERKSMHVLFHRASGIMVIAPTHKIHWNIATFADTLTSKPGLKVNDHVFTCEQATALSPLAHE